MVRSLIRFGYLEDSRIEAGINWIVKYQRFDDGIKEAPKGWPYDKFERCWGKHTCYMAIIKTLKALSEIPTDKISRAVKNTIDKGADFKCSFIHYVHGVPPLKHCKESSGY